MYSCKGNLQFHFNAASIPGDCLSMLDPKVRERQARALFIKERSVWYFSRRIREEGGRIWGILCIFQLPAYRFTARHEEDHRVSNACRRSCCCPSCSNSLRKCDKNLDNPVGSVFLGCEKIIEFCRRCGRSAVGETRPRRGLHLRANSEMKQKH